MAVAYRSGRCPRGSYSQCLEAMEFHYLENNGNDDKGYPESWERIQREVDKYILLCANCHREVRSGLQLPRETVAEKSGEFREACPSPMAKNGNPEPSLERLLLWEGAETRALARTPESLLRGKRPTPYRQDTDAGEEIVQAQEKSWGIL